MTAALDLPASHMRERYEAPVRSWRDAITKLRALQEELRAMPDVDETRLRYILDHGFEDLVSEFDFERQREADTLAAWERDGCSTADERYDTLRKLAMEDAL